MTTQEALNVEADELTHVAMKLQADVKEYHKFLTNKVNFKINSQYINSHYPRKRVNLAFHSMVLREYFATTHGWTAKNRLIVVASIFSITGEAIRSRQIANTNICKQQMVDNIPVAKVLQEIHKHGIL
jgi:hypothetical protein